MQRIDCRKVGVTQPCHTRARAQNRAGRRGQHGVFRARENLPDLRWTSTLRAHSWGQKCAFQGGQIDAEALYGIANGRPNNNARRPKVRLVTRGVKVRQLGHDLTCDRASVLPAGVLDRCPLGVGGQRQDEASPTGGFGQLQRGGQRANTQLGRELHGVTGDCGEIRQVGLGIAGHRRTNVAALGINDAQRAHLAAGGNHLFEDGDTA